MARRPTPLHRLVLRRHHGRAVCKYRGREWSFGPWDDARDAPSPAALAAFQQQLARWTADPTAGEAPAVGELLFDLWADWLTSGAAGADRRDERERCARALFVTPELPGPHYRTPLAEFGGPQLAAWRDILCQAVWPAGHRQAGERRYGRYTVGRYVAMVKACVRWAEERGRIGEDRASALLRVGPPAKGQVREAVKRRAVPRERVDSVLPLLTPPLRAAAELLWLTCARPEEVLTLRRGEIVTGGKLMAASGVVIDLTRLRVWAAVRDEHKTADGGYDRVIFFGRRGRAVLAPFLDRDPAEFLFTPAEGRADWAARMTARRKPGNYGTYKRRRGAAAERLPGACYGYRALNTAVKRACRRAGVPVWTPYQLRHVTFKRVQAEFGRDAARVYGGHKVGGATEIYAGADLTTAARVAAKLG